MGRKGRYLEITLADLADQAAKRTAELLEDALSRLPQPNSGGSLSHCADCGEPIPMARQKAVVGVRLCVTCQTLVEKYGKDYVA